MKQLKRFISVPVAFKAIVATAVLGVASFAGLSGASADAPQFNNAPYDKPTLQVSKAGDTEWYNSVSGLKQNDIVNFLVWDDNTVANTVAQNVRLRVALDSGFGSTHGATGYVSADNAATKSHDVTINTVADAKLSYIPGSARFYNAELVSGTDFRLAEAAFPNGINADTITTGGIVIGNQASGINNIHAVQFQARVESGTPPSTPTLPSSATPVRKLSVPPPLLLLATA